MNADVLLNLSYLEVLFYLQGACAFIYAWWRTKNLGFLVLLVAVSLFWVPLRDCAVNWVVRDLLLALFPIGSKELNAEYLYGLMTRLSVAWSLVTAFQILTAVFGLGLIVKGLAKAKADVSGVSWKVRMRRTLLPIAAVVVGGPLVMFLVGAACVHFSASARHASVMRRLAAVDSKELLAACRTVLADHVSYRRDPNYRGSCISLDLKDPKMPEAVRVLGPDKVIVLIDEASHLFDRLEIIMGRDVTVAAFAEGKDPKGVSFGKKIIEGLYYAEGERASVR